MSNIYTKVRDRLMGRLMEKRAAEVPPELLNELRALQYNQDKLEDRVSEQESKLEWTRKLPDSNQKKNRITLLENLLIEQMGRARSNESFLDSAKQKYRELAGHDWVPTSAPAMPHTHQEGLQPPEADETPLSKQKILSPQTIRHEKKPRKPQIMGPGGEKMPGKLTKTPKTIETPSGDVVVPDVDYGQDATTIMRSVIEAIFLKMRDAGKVSNEDGEVEDRGGPEFGDFAKKMIMYLNGALNGQTPKPDFLEGSQFLYLNRTDGTAMEKDEANAYVAEVLDQSIDKLRGYDALLTQVVSSRGILGKDDLRYSTVPEFLKGDEEGKDQTAPFVKKNPGEKPNVKVPIGTDEPVLPPGQSLFYDFKKPEEDQTELIARLNDIKERAISGAWDGIYRRIIIRLPALKLTGDEGRPEGGATGKGVKIRHQDKAPVETVKKYEDIRIALLRVSDTIRILKRKGTDPDRLAKAEEAESKLEKIKRELEQEWPQLRNSDYEASLSGGAAAPRHSGEDPGKRQVEQMMEGVSPTRFEGTKRRENLTYRDEKEDDKPVVRRVLPGSTTRTRQSVQNIDSLVKLAVRKKKRDQMRALKPVQVFQDPAVRHQKDLDSRKMKEGPAETGSEEVLKQFQDWSTLHRQEGSGGEFDVTGPGMDKNSVTLRQELNENLQELMLDWAKFEEAGRKANEREWTAAYMKVQRLFSAIGQLGKGLGERFVDLRSDWEQVKEVLAVFKRKKVPEDDDRSVRANQLRLKLESEMKNILELLRASKKAIDEKKGKMETGGFKSYKERQVNPKNKALEQQMGVETDSET